MPGGVHWRWALKRYAESVQEPSTNGIAGFVQDWKAYKRFLSIDQWNVPVFTLRSSSSEGTQWSKTLLVFKVPDWLWKLTINSPRMLMPHTKSSNPLLAGPTANPVKEDEKSLESSGLIYSRIWTSANILLLHTQNFPHGNAIIGHQYDAKKFEYANATSLREESCVRSDRFTVNVLP